MRKLYNSQHMNPDAGNIQLQRKVLFDLIFYFYRRGRENIRAMEKDTFQLHYDVDTGVSYVKKVKDEQTKNHKETNQEIQTGFMPQVLSSNGTPQTMSS